MRLVILLLSMVTLSAQASELYCTPSDVGFPTMKITITPDGVTIVPVEKPVVLKQEGDE